jgi:hypothetical protein
MAEGNQPDDDEIDILISMFSRSFFDKANLMDRISFTWRWEEDINVVGYTRPPPGNSTSPRAVYIRMTPGYRPLANAMWYYSYWIVETLLHEMCHAYLLVYAWQCEECEETGAHHRKAFTDLAFAVRMAVEMHLDLRQGPFEEEAAGEGPGLH